LEVSVGFQLHTDPCQNGFQFAQLKLMGGFELRCCGDTLPLPLGAQRVLAFLGLHDIPLMRAYIGEALWPESDRRHASANLRSAVWRIRQTGHHLLEASSRQLNLASAVEVDVREGRALAHRLLDRSMDCVPDDLGPSALAVLSLSLLPDWFDEWLSLERERWNQLRLHALEALAERLLAINKYSQAVEAALAAVWVEPLRESAHRLLIRVHAAEGNWSEVMSQYERYRRLLHRELRVLPTDQMESLIRVLTPR
jgi:DNA-binding SARP family transcriptional activator